jgi:hypothetical protein
MRRAAAIVALLGAAVLLPGCQKMVKTASTSVSPCFRVLPEAHTAVGGQGKFVDVARVRGGRVTRLSTPTSTSLAPSTSQAPGTTVAPGRRDVCVVAYSGTFDPSRIQHLIGRAQGKYAIVIVGVQTRRVRAVLLTDTLPSPLKAH